MSQLLQGRQQAWKRFGNCIIAPTSRTVLHKKFTRMLDCSTYSYLLEGIFVLESVTQINQDQRGAN